MNEQALKQVLKNLNKKDIEIELNNLSKDPDKVAKELQVITNNMSSRDIEQQVKKDGSVEKFSQMLIKYLAFKASLIKKGLSVGVAAGAGAAIVFGTGSLCHDVACSTGCSTIGDMADGMDAVGEVALNISDFGFEVAANNIGFFGELIDGVFSIFD